MPSRSQIRTEHGTFGTIVRTEPLVGGLDSVRGPMAAAAPEQNVDWLEQAELVMGGISDA